MLNFDGARISTQPILFKTCVCFQGRKDAANAIVTQHAPNAVLIPSSNHPDIMAGQGTISMELLEQVLKNLHSKHLIEATPEIGTLSLVRSLCKVCFSTSRP